MSEAPDNAAMVAAMVRDFDFPRYAASLFAPEDKRRAMLALAAFDLDIMRIADHVSQPLPGEVRLQWWIDTLEGTAHGGIAGHPVAAELLHAIETHALPREPFLSLIAAHRFDLYDDPMPTLKALEVYCDDTVGSLIGLTASLLANEPAFEASRYAGRALGLARLLARLPHDAAHRRCFLPHDNMTAHGVSRHQVLAGNGAPGLQAVRGDLIVKARKHLDAAREALKAQSRTLRPALLPLATLRHELDALDRMAPFALAPVPSRLRMLASQGWMMWRLS